MRNRFDQFGKQMVRAALEGSCTVETDAEVPAEPRRIDLWFMLRDAEAPLLEHLGLLGRIARRAGTLEFFHNPPSTHELVACLIKRGELRLHLPRRTAAPPLPLPIQWILCAGRPGRVIDGFAFRAIPGWPSGVYEGPPQLWTRLVVVNELPIERSTLMLRLLGAGAVLRRAIVELRALPTDAPERILALPLLVDLGFTVMNEEPAMRTPEDEEFLRYTRPLVDAWREAAVQEGVMKGFKQGLDEGLSKGLDEGLSKGLKQGLDEGFEKAHVQSLERNRKLLLLLLRRRFGDDVDGATEQQLAAASAAQIEIWLERVVSAATLAELLAR